jgi:hypothetical protein
MEEHILNIFENDVLRKTFGPKRDNIAAELHSKELHNCYVLLVVLRQVKQEVAMGGTCGIH